MPPPSFTLIESAELNGIDPRAWLADVLAAAGYPMLRIHQLLPWPMVWIAQTSRLTAPFATCMMVRLVPRGSIARPRLADEIDVDRVDLEALDGFLMSDRIAAGQHDVSDLDGFLTGIAIGPELLLPSEWLPLIWGGQAPEFADEAEAKVIVGAVMGRYNEILRLIADDACEPIFWADRDGTLIAADWAEGFLQAIMLRADAWERLFKSKRDGGCFTPSSRSAAMRTAIRCWVSRRMTKTA